MFNSITGRKDSWAAHISIWVFFCICLLAYQDFPSSLLCQHRDRTLLGCLFVFKKPNLPPCQHWKTQRKENHFLTSKGFYELSRNHRTKLAVIGLYEVKDIRNWCNSVFNVPFPQRQIPSNLPSWICSSLLWPHCPPSALIPVLRRDSTEVQADKQQMNSFCALIDFWGQWGLHGPAFPYLQSNSAYGMETFISSSRNGMITVFIFPGACARLITMVPALHWLLATTFCYRRLLVGPKREPGSARDHGCCSWVPWGGGWMSVLLIIPQCLHPGSLWCAKCLSSPGRLRGCGLLITSTLKYINHDPTKGKGREAAISC